MCISSNKYSDKSYKLNELVYSKTYEEEMEEQRQIELAVEYLRRFGVETTIEYGGYRASYNILKDLGKYLAQNNMHEEVIQAEWVYDHWCEFKCSNCGNWSNSQPYKGREKYCPECGAKMKV